MGRRFGQHSPGSEGGEFPTRLDFNVGVKPTAITAGDFDADGDADLAVANETFFYNAATVILNNGDGTFGTKTHYAAGLQSWDIVSADVSGDGFLDLALANRLSDNVSVHRGRVMAPSSQPRAF